VHLAAERVDAGGLHPSHHTTCGIFASIQGCGHRMLLVPMLRKAL
jgi:hypothetical protein